MEEVENVENAKGGAMQPRATELLAGGNRKKAGTIFSNSFSKTPLMIDRSSSMPLESVECA